MNLKQQITVLLAISLGGCAVEAAELDPDVEALADSEHALCRNALTPSEEKTALKLIDDICGDTWCEGDNNFAFERLTCRSAGTASASGGSCTLKLRIISREDDPRSYPRTCTTSGFRGFASLVVTAQSGYQSLEWDYYLKLSECINQLESELPR